VLTLASELEMLTCEVLTDASELERLT